MCGIAGVIGGSESVVRDALRRVIDAQRHRGPDDCGESYEPFGGGGRMLGLGHRRLSILDLSPAGHQPMSDPATGNHIVFNGEIYNFQALRRALEAAGETFHGTGDTEVLLRALTRWGPEALHRLQGMYAFAFLDRRAGTLLLARDPMGIKPLYVAEHDGNVVFASEVRAVLASGLVPREIDVQGVAGLLAYGAVQQPRTIIRRVRSLPPGSYQTLSAGGAVTGGTTTPPTRFWRFQTPRPQLTGPEAVAAVRETMEAAVRDHLVSDVPVGVFLSSGLDSTVIAALAAEHTAALRSFTVGFADHADMSELRMAAETARLLGLQHTNIQVEGRDAERAAVEWLSSLDQPSVDGLNVYVISKAVRAHGVTVALSGQGGDELFGGYPSFADVPRLHRWMGWGRRLPVPLRAGAARAATVRKSHAVRQKLLDVVRTDGSVLGLYLQRRRAMSNAQLAALGLDAGRLGLTPSYTPPEATDVLDLEGQELIGQISQMESRFYQGNMLLRDGDANGMAHGLEIRVPMLDKRMLDLAGTLPDGVRLPSGRADKHLLRVAFADRLRPELLAQGKRGFTLPINRWMVGPLRELCEGATASLKGAGILRPEGVDAVWNAFRAEPESSTWSRAFTLCVLGSYVRSMGLT